MAITIGIDVGSGSIKTVLIDYPDTDSEQPRVRSSRVERIRKRKPSAIVEESYHEVLEETGLQESDIDYVASTGEGELVTFRRGHFFGMTTHARGAHFLFPETRAVVDIGALHARAIKVDDRSRVLKYKMTGQCASGSGQFLENITRYLGISVDEVGELSLQSRNPEVVSGICAVLAETDVINMVSRGITTPDILKGIHVSIGNRLVRLLRAIQAESPVTLTGGLATDVGLVAAMKERMEKDGIELELLTHPDSILAGAIGAALWGGFRLQRLAATAGAR